MGDAAMAVVLGVSVLILLRGAWKGVDCYAAFRAGAEDGTRTGMKLFPALTAVLLMMGLMQGSGMMALLTTAMRPITAVLGLPEEAASVLLLRPMSGSGALAALTELCTQYGVDSRAARIASVLSGASETIFYTMAVYLSAAKVKRLPGVVAISLISYIVGAWVAGCML